MQVVSVTGLPISSTERQVLAIGKFDGVHVGHQQILMAAKERLSDHALLSVMTIWPHPAWVLSGKAEFKCALTPGREKVRRLALEGVRRVYDVQFTRDFASTSAELFVQNYLAPLSLDAVVVGADFHFGYGGTATAATMTDLCSRFGVPVTVVSDVEENGVKVSSSQIRRHLEHGRVEAAEVLLGRPYTVQGIVIHGDARGRQIGFPTANLALDADYVLPESGVYAVSVAVQPEKGNQDSHWFGVLNAGTRPTVNGSDFRLEVHILDFTGDLYDRTLRVSFLRKIRDERRFDSLVALKEQISVDVTQVRRMFQG